MADKYKILIADDHPILTAGLKLAIAEWDDFVLTGIASNGQETIELCEKDTPDIILLDLQMPVMSGSEATRIIKSHYPGVKIVALTTFYDADIIDEAMNAGCDGFLLKTISPEQLKASLVSVLNGISIIDTDALEQLRKRKNAKTSVEFNGRELEMLGYICKGLSNKEIAEKLSLQPGTVKNMVSLLLNKTYCISRADLTRYAIEHKLV